MNVHVRAEWARKISILFVISGTRGHKLIFNRGAGLPTRNNRRNVVST